MAGVNIENLGDLLKITQNELGEMKLTEITTDLQKHWALSNLMRKNRTSLDSGPQIEFRILTQHNNQARNTAPYEVDDVQKKDGVVVATLNWRFTDTSYGIDFREVLLNRSPRKIFDIVKEQRIMAMISLAAKMEDNFWVFPSATDTKTPLGLPYWIHKNATEGFNGGIPSGYSDVAGVSPTTYPRWQNWTFQYTSVTHDDFIRKAREAATKTRFSPPVRNIPTYDTGHNMGYFTNYNVIAPLEERLESQNDNLGNDVASKDGQTLFRRTPVNYVPKLDDDTTDPFYAIPWGVFKLKVLRGLWLKETRVEQTPGQHLVMTQFVDCGYQFCMTDRRQGFVGATGTSYPS